ncbi:MAG: hypothetical protein U0744_12895 [Gemmataceae bacterium]
MTEWQWMLLGGLSAFAILAYAAFAFLRSRGMGRWIGHYVLHRLTSTRARTEGPIDVFICFADHYEPKAYGADRDTGLRRVETWHREFPEKFARFKDSDGRAPRWTYFFPEEEYEPEYLDLLADLCRRGFGEVEIHLHHFDDTADGLREKLERFKSILVDRHGLLSHDAMGRTRYAFIHGNWTLCNGRDDGQYCGVDNELAILHETGCFVDMTFPSAPSPTQPKIFNSIYWAADIPGRKRSHEVAYPLGGKRPDDSLLMLQGPLMLDWSNRKWGLLPRLEHACLQETQLPTMRRLDLWLDAGVHVPARPEWRFVKLHMHGAPEDAHHALLGEPMIRFHEALADRAARDKNFRYHYVTAREMHNLARAAESGFEGPVAEALNFEVVSNLALSPVAS